MADNFPKIDRFENQEATSIKSLDLTLESYQDVSILKRTVKKYIDIMAEYQGQFTAWSGIKILPRDVKSRAVDLAIPMRGATQAQLKTLEDLQGYAASQVPSVRLRIIPIP